MIGPFPEGHWTCSGANSGSEYRHLKAGDRYRVQRAFEDFDGDVHPVGETWVFRGYSFLPYDDGLSLIVSLDGVQEWHIRLQARAEQQRNIVDNLDDHVSLVG